MNEKKSITEKIAELEQAAEWFYSDEFDLSKAVENYRAAMKLSAEIKKDLDDLTNKIEVVEKDFTKD